MDYNKLAIEKHLEWKGKIEVISRVSIKTREDLSVAYTPGVAAPCLEIAEDESKAYDLTRKNNLVAVITDGTAVLGLGDIGPSAAMPVMEGKCALFKEFADIDAFPICINSKDVDEIVNTIYLISKSFGGINLEDISAPRCFEIEDRLKKVCDIPIFHDDQHGTAIIVCAALINAAKVVGKNKEDMTIVVNGAGAAGTAVIKLLIDMSFGNVIMCDSKGIISKDIPGLKGMKAEMAQVTNKCNKIGSLNDALVGADVFVGVSKPNIVTAGMISTMAKNSIVLAMANPTPEIMPDEAKLGGAMVVGTGRSDFPNQINNVSAFPGVFKGALKVRASEITNSMKIKAALALANMVPEELLTPDNILPNPLDRTIVNVISEAVSEEAIKVGVSRI